MNTLHARLKSTLVKSFLFLPHLLKSNAVMSSNCIVLNGLTRNPFSVIEFAHVFKC